MQDLSKYKCAIFDCDGVILQSNKIKTNAFIRSLEGEPNDLIDQFITYHKNNGGISRYVKFEYYYRYIKHDRNYKIMAEKAVYHYSKIVVNKLITAKYVPGVIDIIDYFNSNNIPCFVISGGDQNELNEVFLRRKINNNFVEILGSPDTKIQHASTMIKQSKINLPGVLFGDASLDMEIANFLGLDFVFIHGYSEWSNGYSIVTNNNLPVYRNFKEIMPRKKII